MNILAVDPGVTTGYVLFKYITLPVIVTWQQHKADNIGKAIEPLRDIGITGVEVVVIEDYRIYQGAEGMHVGIRLYTAELIGAIKAICALQGVAVQMMSAQKKQRWPVARLDKRFPQSRKVAGIHARDAMKIGLAFFEKYTDWHP